jgi:hypothetical protein
VPTEGEPCRAILFFLNQKFEASIRPGSFKGVFQSFSKSGSHSKRLLRKTAESTCLLLLQQSSLWKRSESQSSQIGDPSDKFSTSLLTCNGSSEWASHLFELVDAVLEAIHHPILLVRLAHFKGLFVVLFNGSRYLRNAEALYRAPPPLLRLALPVVQRLPNGVPGRGNRFVFELGDKWVPKPSILRGLETLRRDTRGLITSDARSKRLHRCLIKAYSAIKC